MAPTPHESTSPGLLERIRALEPERGGLCPGEALVVGLSGGPDSVVLLDVLQRLASERQLTLIAAHLDHGLRGESREDATFCASLAQARGVPFRTSRVDVGKVAASTGLGLEAAGRQVRHQWLETVRDAEGADRIALGHHLDDHVETLLLWIFRGTGMRGMRGILPVRDRIVRPLRSLRRREIMEYASRHALAFIEDASNASADFLRNRVRQELVPRIEDIFEGDATGRLAEFARRLETDLTALETLGRRALDRCRLESGELAEPNARPAIRVHRPGWLDEPQEIQFYALRTILDELPTAEPRQRWNEEAFRRVLEFAREAPAGKKTPLPGGGWLRVRRDDLTFEPAGSQRQTDPRPDRPSDPQGDRGPAWGSNRSQEQQKGRFRLVEELLPPSGDVVTFFEDEWACFDADCVCPPLSLRLAQPGDRMRPLGMSGRKKLTALYREHDVPGELRSSMFVVADARQIIWAVGVATAEETRVTANTKRILKLSLDPVL